MRILILAALLPVPAVAAIVPVSPAKHCAIDDRVQAAARAGADGLHRLDQLPPAKDYLTVFRTVDRCPAPVIVRSEIGGAPRR